MYHVRTPNVKQLERNFSECISKDKTNFLSKRFFRRPGQVGPLFINVLLTLKNA